MQCTINFRRFEADLIEVIYNKNKISTIVAIQSEVNYY